MIPTIMLRAIPYTSLWFGLIMWIVFGSALLLGTGWYLYEDYLFAYHSQSTTGIVERLYITSSHGRHSSSLTHHLKYHYTAGDMTLSGTASIETNTYYALSVGQKFPVLYLPAKVADNRVNLPAEQQEVRVNTWALSVVSLIVAVAGAFILRYYARQNQLYRTLLARGVTCQGIVDSVPYNLVGKNKVARFYLTFTFTDSQGRTRTGKSWYLKRGDEVRWHTGDPVTVYFDAANSAKFTVDLKR